VQDVIAAARARYAVTLQTTTVAEETMTFKIPRILTNAG
jgi:hypothetical protein